MMKTDP